MSFASDPCSQNDTDAAEASEQAPPVTDWAKKCGLDPGSTKRETNPYRSGVSSSVLANANRETTGKLYQTGRSAPAKTVPANGTSKDETAAAPEKKEKAEARASSPLRGKGSAQMRVQDMMKQ